MDLSDRELLARTLQAEAGNQGPAGLLAAGSVIMNRANMPGYGDGVRGAILAPGQFSAWNSVTGYAGGEQGQNMETMRPGQEAYATADQLLSGEYQDPTGGATHYYNPSISNPAWGRDRAGGDWQQIGDHIFGFADAGRENSTRGAPQMAMQPTQPQGLLGQLGIQRRDPTAQGETALPFYQRSRFGNTMGNLAMAFNSLRQRPDDNIPRIVTGQRATREQDAANNRTVEWLSSQPGGERFAGLVDSVGAAGALQAYQQAQPAPSYRVVRGSEIGLEGPAGDRLYNVAPDGKTTAIGGGDINAGTPQSVLETAFMQNTGRQTAEETSDVVVAGADAQRSLGQIDVLEGALLAEDAPEGMEAAFKAFGGRYGIETEGTAGLQLAEAIISQLVPGQRPPGSGQMSDADLALFKRSLPQLIYTRDGNQEIINTMRAMADYDVARAQIARQLQFGDLNLRDATAAYDALGNPLQLYRNIAEAEAAAGDGDTPSPSGVAVIRYDAQGNRIE